MFLVPFHRVVPIQAFVSLNLLLLSSLRLPTMPMDRIQASSESPSTRLIVLSIECLKGSSHADEWTGDMLQTGDIVEELTIGSSMCVRAPFKNGRSGIQRILHGSFKDKQTSIVVRVRRGRDEFSELQACIVPNDSGGKKQYVLRSITDPNYVVGFVDRTESECFDLQGRLACFSWRPVFLTFLSAPHFHFHTCYIAITSIWGFFFLSFFKKIEVFHPL